jgi:TonB family protein
MGRRKNDIERYLRGEMTPSEMHELEKEALNDPFLSEALEGATHAGADSFLFDLKELRRSFPHRHHKRHKPQIISMWRWSLGIAAGLMLLAVSSVYIIFTITRPPANNENMAMKPDSSAQQPVEATEKKADMDSAASAQQLSLNTPRKKNSGADTKPSVRGEKQKTSTQPSSIAGLNDKEAANKTEPVVEPETADRKPEGNAEAERTEAPQEIVSEEVAVRPLAEELKQPLKSEPAASEHKKREGVSSRIIRGKVTSEEDGTALPGVNVLVRGTSKGTVTDANGAYEVAVDDATQVLVFAFIGYKTSEVSPENKPEVNVQLKNDITALSEVVVVGMGVTHDGYTAPELARPEGGREAFRQYLKKNLKYPEAAIKNKIEGRVTVQFTVSPNGQLSDFKVLKGIDSQCDAELIRLIQQGPAWSPSKQNNQAVTDKVKVRFKFELPR